MKLVTFSSACRIVCVICIAGILLLAFTGATSSRSASDKETVYVREGSDASAASGAHELDLDTELENFSRTPGEDYDSGEDQWDGDKDSQVSLQELEEEEIAARAAATAALEEHRRTRVLLQEAEIEANSISESLLSINAGGSTKGVAEDVPRVSEEDAEEILQEVVQAEAEPLLQDWGSVPSGLLRKNLVPALLVVTMDGVLHSLNLFSGQVNWSVKTGRPIALSNMHKSHAESMMTLATLDGNLMAYSKELGVATLNKQELFGTASPFKTEDNARCISSKETRLMRIHARTGKIISDSSAVKHDDFATKCPPERAEDDLYVSRSDFMIRCIDDFSGEDRWNSSVAEFDVQLQNKAKQPLPKAAIPALPILAASIDGELVALNATTEQLLWKAELDAPASVATLRTIIFGQLAVVRSVQRYQASSEEPGHGSGTTGAVKVKGSKDESKDPWLHIRSHKGQVYAVASSQGKIFPSMGSLLLAKKPNAMVVPSSRTPKMEKNADATSLVVSKEVLLRHDQQTSATMQPGGTYSVQLSIPLDLQSASKTLPNAVEVLSAQGQGEWELDWAWKDTVELAKNTVITTIVVVTIIVGAFQLYGLFKPKNPKNPKSPRKPKASSKEEASPALAPDTAPDSPLPGAALPGPASQQKASSPGHVEGKKSADRSTSAGDGETPGSETLDNPKGDRRISRYKEEYEEVERLGHGAFGAVFRVKNKVDGNEYAIKKVRITEAKTDQVREEVGIISKLDHPNVIRYYTSWFEVDDGSSDCDVASSQSPDTRTGCGSFTLGTPSASETLSVRRGGNLLRHTLTHQWSLTGENLSLDGLDSLSPQRKDPAVQLAVKDWVFSGDSSSESGFSFDRDSKSPTSPRSPWSPACPRTDNKCHQDTTEEGSTEEDSPSAIDGKVMQILYIQMQLCEPKNLFDWLQTPQREVQAASESHVECLDKFKQIVEGLRYVHEQRLIHRDLKPANILMRKESNRGEVMKLADFGLSRSLPQRDLVEEIAQHRGEYLPHQAMRKHADRSMTMGIGTPTYTSPELLHAKDGRCTYTAMADIFSLGIILCEIFHPFATGMERAHVLMQVRNGSIPAHLETSFPHEMRLLRAMLSHDPLKRPSAEQILCDGVFDCLESRLPGRVRTITQRSVNTDRLDNEEDLQTQNIRLTEKLERMELMMERMSAFNNSD